MFRFLIYKAVQKYNQHVISRLHPDTNLDTDKEGAVPKKLPHGNSMPNGESKNSHTLLSTY